MTNAKMSKNRAFCAKRAKKKAACTPKPSGELMARHDVSSDFLDEKRKAVRLLKRIIKVKGIIFLPKKCTWKRKNA